MDGNKDEAVKCMNIGYKALKDGDKPRACKFLSKASRLDPSLPVKDLLYSISEEIERDKTDCSTSSQENGQDTVKSKIRSTAGSDPMMNSCHKANEPTSFSSEQVEVVLRIKRTKDYYLMLGLNKGCTAEEVRKAYRKLSLKVHPDKNKAPGAEEAFKAVSKAFVCLSDEGKRKKYDQFGPEDSQVAEQQYSGRYRSNGFYEDAFDAEEIFNSFFFGSSYPNYAFHRSAQFVRAHSTAGHTMGGGGRTQEVHFGSFFHLLRLLPVIALILISIFPISRPVYNLDRVEPYLYQHFTEKGVPYFVKSQNFDKEYPHGSRTRIDIEAQVHRDYREILTYNCRVELERRIWSPSFRTPHCDRLKEV